MLKSSNVSCRQNLNRIQIKNTRVLLIIVEQVLFRFLVVLILWIDNTGLWFLLYFTRAVWYGKKIY